MTVWAIDFFVMKVLHVITSLLTGGAEVLVVNLMPRFRALGHEVGVHDDCQYYQQIAARCYERAKEFDISKMASAYAEVYRQLIIDN